MNLSVDTYDMPSTTPDAARGGEGAIKGAPVNSSGAPIAQSDDGAKEDSPTEKSFIAAIKDKTAKARYATISFLPAFVVNNSSNVLGASHVATEIAMFKASLKEDKLVKNPKSIVSWIVDPIVTMFKGVAEGAKPKDLNYRELFSGNPIKNIRERIFNVEAATTREYSRQMAEGISHANVKLANRWQTRSTFIGLVIWSLSAIIPEKKETEEEIEKNAVLRTTHPIQYGIQRLKEALWIPDWAKHKREMIGLGVNLAGICSMIGSRRNRIEISPSDSGLAYKTFKYGFNPSYFGTGAAMYLSSFPLLFALDEKSAYSQFGWVHLLRSVFLPTSILSKYKNKEPGRHWYTGAATSFQIENILQGLFGGAQKLPDGTIIDHETLKREAVAEAKRLKQELKHSKLPPSEKTGKVEALGSDDAPTPTIAGPAQVERAMPERAVAQQEAAGV